MNKKLFFAGFALLAAVSFTSCNSDNPIDVTNPNGVSPTVYKAPCVIPGTADLTMAIKASGDVTTLWNDTKQVTSDMKKALKAANEITVEIDCSEYKLDGATMVLPDFFQGTAKGKVLNLKFINQFAEAKKPLDIDASNLANALVNVTVPAQEFEMKADFSKVRSTLASDGATIKMFSGITAADSKSALVVKDGITIKAIDLTAGNVIKDGGEIEALYDAKGLATAGKNGFGVGDNEFTFVDNLITGAATEWVSGVGPKDKGVINNIYIGASKQLRVFQDDITSIEAIEGLGDITKTPSHLADVCDAATIIKNVIIDAATATVKKDNFSGVIFAGDVKLQSDDIEDVTVKGDVEVFFNKDDKTFTFKGLTFANKLKVDGAVATAEEITTKQYQWIVDHYELVVGGKINKDNEGYTAVDYYKGTATDDGAGNYTIKDKDGKVVKDHIVNVLTPAAGANLAPKNALVVLDENCKIKTKAASSASIKELTDLFVQPTAAASEEYPEKPWYNVKVGDKLYTWTKAAAADRPTYYYYLVAAE